MGYQILQSSQRLCSKHHLESTFIKFPSKLHKVSNDFVLVEISINSQVMQWGGQGRRRTKEGGIWPTFFLFFRNIHGQKEFPFLGHECFECFFF